MDTTHHTETTTREPDAKRQEVLEIRLPAGWTWEWVSFLAPGVVGGAFMTAGIMEHVLNDPATNGWADVTYAIIIGFYETFLLCGLSGLLAYMLFRDSIRFLKRHGIIGDQMHATHTGESSSPGESGSDAAVHSSSPDGDGPTT